MSSSNSSTNPPPSAARDTPTTRDSDPSPSTTEPAPPPPAGIGLELSPGGDKATGTPAQIGADQDRAGAATKESMEHITRDEDAPVPPVQTAAAHEEMESTIKKSVQHTQGEDVPMTPSQIAAGFENMDRVIKETGKDAGMVPPPPPSQIATPAEEMEDYDEEYESKKTAAPTTQVDGNTSPPSLSAVLPVDEQEEILQRAQDPSAPAVARAPSSPPTDHGRSPPNPGGQQQLPIRPPPPSMMPSPDVDADPPVPALLCDPSMTPVVATLVEEQPEIPVYDAIQVPEQSRLEKNKKFIIGVGMVMLVGLSVATGVSVSSNNGSSESDTIEPEGVVLSTARPSESYSPSGIPSLQSTTRPSESSPPSDLPSLRPTLGPSRSLAPSTSLRPTSSLRPSSIYCGEINILTDEYPNETSWNLVRIDTIGGISSTVVLEGSPEEEGLNTYEACLERGDYEFAIFDSCGDGIFSPGYYSVAFDGVLIARGGDFESEARVSFSLPPPSPQPSESSSPSETPSSSLQPSPLRSSPPSTYWSSLNWSQLGLGFNGDASDDFFGESVAFSADASTMAIGAPAWVGDRPGYVKVYGREGEGSGWEQRGDTLRGEGSNDNFGLSLSLSEDGMTLSIGAPRHGSVGPDSGQVKVYEWDEATLNYVQIGDTLYGAASGDNFGSSLDISNDKILAVGADDSDANGSDSGQVTIYAWDDASSNFKQRGEAIDGDAADDWLGLSVSLAENGQKLAVGAPNIGIESGQVRVFEWDEAASNYKQLGDSLLGDAAGDRFGWSVSFSRDGTTLVIGAPDNDQNGRSSGQVKVFGWDEAALNFVQIGQSLYGRAAGDSFGWSVALSSAGKTLAIGAYQYNTGGPGYVEVYEWDEAGLEYKRLGQSLGGEASSGFGWALALAGNGRDFAIGAPFNNRNGTHSGRVEVFHIEL